jgi:hypothetical protein
MKEAVSRRLDELLSDYKRAQDEGRVADANRLWAEYERVRLAVLHLEVARERMSSATPTPGDS